jgi:putative hemolysin
MEYEIVLTSILLLLLLFVATFESAFMQLSDVALRALVSENRGKKRAKFLRYLVDHHQLLWLTVLSGLQFTAVTLALLLTSLGVHVGLSLGQAVLAALGISLLIGGVLGQFLPRILTQNNPGRALLFLLPAFLVYYRVFSLPSRLIYHILSNYREERTITPESVQADTGEQDIQALLEVGAEEGIIEEAESKLIHSVIEFTDTTVAEVMTPRTELLALPTEATVEQAYEMMVKMKHSRIPVYRDSIDSVEGIVYVHEVMAAWREGKAAQPVSSIARKVYFVPKTKQIAELLREMQHGKRYIALVVDEYGVTAGLVTIEDLIEEIIGEIAQEENVDEPVADEVLTQLDGSYLVRGTTEIRKLELLLDRELAVDDFSTVAGFVIKYLGRFPSIGETFVCKDLAIEVLETEAGRIHQVRVKKVSLNGESSEARNDANGR